MNDPLEKLFNGYRPDLGDSRKFMDSLSRKLEIADMIKEDMEREKRASRMRILTVFILGSVTGGLAIHFLSTYPFDISYSGIMSWITANTRQVLETVCICALVGYIAASAFLKGETA